MIKNFFDLKIASFDSMNEVNFEEVLLSDVFEIRGYVEGGIYHSSHMYWVGNLNNVDQVDQVIRSKKERKVLVENKMWFERAGFTFEIVKMDKERFNEFFELYKNTTLKRERPLTFSLKEQILGKVFIEAPVYLIGMFKDGVLESGLVFSVSEEGQALVSFGAKKKFKERRGGVGGVLEYLLIEFCLQHKITQIGHGKSLNPAGITGKSGIFEFKARYGFSAFPQGYWKTTFILNPRIALSDMVFVSTIDEQVGYLVVTDDQGPEISKRYQTKEVKKIKLLSKSEVVLMAKHFIEKHK